MYFEVDEPMRVEVLQKIIETLEEPGFKVRGVSFDLGNPSFLSEVKFYEGENFIEHPLDPNRKLYLVPDVPHMLKLFRNHMFNKGFYFPKNPFDNVQLYIQCQTSTL